MMYYAFTSLSTVGFGDYYPKSNKERLFIALVLLIGVAVFSLVLGNFNEIMEEIRLLGKEVNEEEELNRFFSLIRKMNSGNEFDHEKRTNIENFMIVKWNEDKNNSMIEESDEKLIEQLPVDIQGEIRHKFLFNDFLVKFHNVFTFRK